MRRIHPDPDAFAMKNLSQIVSAFGVSMPKTPDRYVLQRILQGVKGKDYSMAVNLAVLKSFEKAQYSPLNIGHFALASRHYCHFTSPIRRYADLLIHRLFEQYLRGNLKGGAKASADNGSELTEIGKHITFTEQRAENAENDLRTALILTMLTDHVGDEYDSVVTGFSSVGVFAQIKRFGIEGYIRIDDLGPDQWQYNQKSHSMTGVKTGQTVHLGTAMKVRIVSVNAAARQLNLLPVEPLVGSREMAGNRGRFSDKNNGNKKKSRFRNRRRR
jgi:ribonuclease R